MKKSILTLGLTLLAVANSFALPDLRSKDSYNASAVSNLDINLSWENLYLKEASSTNTIEVEIYCNKRKFAPTAKLSGSTIVIESAPFKTIMTPFERKQCTVIVYVPSSKKYDKAYISLSSGDLHETNDITAESILLKISSGNINAANLKAEQVQVIASSGDIKVESINASKATVKASSGSIKIGAIESQEITGSTSSGDNRIDSLRANKASFTASSGQIKLSDVIVQDITLETSSGNISAESLLTNRFKVSATSGTIGLELNGAPSKKSSASSSSGTMFVSMPQDAAVTLNVSTSSGSFINAFTKEKIGSHVNYEHPINGGGALVTLSTTSGNITFDSTDGFSISGKTGKSKVIEDDEDDIPVININRPIF